MKIKILRGALRLRNGHDTASDNIASFETGTIVTAAETWTAPEQLQNANGVYQLVGDVWARVIADANGRAVNGWVAVKHMGQIYSEVIADDPAPTDNIEIVKAVVHYRRGGDDVYTQELYPQ